MSKNTVKFHVHLEKFEGNADKLMRELIKRWEGVMHTFALKKKRKKNAVESFSISILANRAFGSPLQKHTLQYTNLKLRTKNDAYENTASGGDINRRSNEASACTARSPAAATP